MCVIIHQPPTAHLDKETARIAWEQNPDGGGFAYIKESGEIELFKAMNFGEFWRHFETARSANPQADFLVHMRIATHGGINLENVHPFWVDEDKTTVMAHNGIFHNVPDYKDGRSDTRVFIDEVLPEYAPDWLDKPYQTYMMEDFIGWSRVVFLTTQPALEKNVYILNPEKGVLHKGMWWSNASYQKKTAVPMKTSSVTYYRGKEWVDTDLGWLNSGSDKDECKLRTDSIVGSTVTTEALMDKRLNLGLEGFIMEIFDGNRREHFWECISCDQLVDPFTGECGCYKYICLECNKYTVDCLCDPDDGREVLHEDAVDPAVMEAAIEAYTAGS